MGPVSGDDGDASLLASNGGPGEFSQSRSFWKNTGDAVSLAGFNDYKQAVLISDVCILRPIPIQSSGCATDGGWIDVPAFLWTGYRA